MLKKYLIPINFLLSIVAALLLFFSVKVWVSKEKTGSISEFQEASGEKKVDLHLKKKHDSMASYSVIYKKNLFRPERKEWRPPPAPKRPSSLSPVASSAITVAPPPPNLKLTGIIASGGSGSYVFLDGTFSTTSAVREITETYEISGVKRTRIRKVGGTATSKMAGKKYFRLNERIANYYTLSEIHAEHVVLTTDSGEKMELRLEMPKKGSTPKSMKVKKGKRPKPLRPKFPPKVSGS